MLNRKLKRALKSKRMMKALTGLGKNEFNRLLQRFKELLEEADNSKQNRKRQPGGGRKHTLRAAADKLFYILFYLKNYPTFDVAGYIFEVDRSQTCRWMHKLLPLLEKVLGKEAVLAVRQIHSVEEFIGLLGGVKDVFIDATERPIRRPGHDEVQKEYYSGKKKRHTLKNIIISDENQKVLLLSETEAGKHHDYRIAKDENVLSNLSEDIGVWVDLGFHGIKKDYPQLNVVIPHKKPRGGELSVEQKAENRIIAGIRVIVEHTIAGIKRLKAVTDPYRNHKFLVADKFILLACGIWNYHLKMASR
jgi:hypothetical protein